MRVGNCKECSTEVRLYAADKLPDHDVWECPKCGHPHAPNEFFNLRNEGAETVGQLIELLKAFPPETEVEAFWEGITTEINNVVLRKGKVLLDVDTLPSTLKHEIPE